MRSGYMNLAPLTCAPRTGKIIGTIGSCMSFDACESKSDTISVPFPSFGIFGGKRLRVYTLPFIVKVLTFAP